MTKFASRYKRGLLAGLLLAQLFLYPAAAFAETDTGDQGSTEPAASQQAPDPAPSSGTTEPAIVEPTPPSQTGPTSPPGDASQTYHYNEATGLWENDYYTWNPVTYQTAPKTPQKYSYNPATGMWDTTEWRYDAPSGTYVPNVVSVPQPTAGDPLIANTGPNSTNNIGTHNTNGGTYDLFFNSTISNKVNSSAHSGNASVLQNTNGGSALSGNASGVVNLLNLLQSSWDPTLAFSADINGDVSGDILLDPNQILNTGPNSQNGIVRTDDTNLDITVQNNGKITNDVDLDVGSGDSTVSQNTNGGDAGTGNADAMVNIMNLINSGIDAGDSFLGVININGNLDGDILLPEKLVAQIDTTGPNSTNTIEENDSNTLQVTSVDNKSIINNTDLSAESGNAVVDSNASAGNATSGQAQTKLNVYNLTGREIIGDNALLVFVNDSDGNWTGLIFDAPAGSHSILGTGPDSTNTINDSTTLSGTVDLNSDSQIENNITASAKSGDALVSQNTNGGSAKTGDATASANILNMINSKLGVSGWFGVLFINVLGSWNGSFGVNTAAGNKAVATSTPSTSAATTANASATGQVFGFVPSGVNQSSATAGDVTAVAGTNSNTPSAPAPDPEPAQVVTRTGLSSNFRMASISIIIGLLLLGAERLLGMLQIRRQSGNPLFKRVI